MNLKFLRSLVIAVCLTAISASTAVSQTGEPLVDFQTLPRHQFTNHQPVVDTEIAAQRSTARIRRNFPEQPRHDHQNLGGDLRRTAQPNSIDSNLHRASYESQTRPSRGILNSRGHDPLPFPRTIEDSSPIDIEQESNLGAVQHAFQAIRSNDASNRSLTSDRPLQGSTDQTLTAAPTPDADTSGQSLAGLGFKSEGVSREFIEKIGYNTLFVLAFGVGFIFIAKAWLKPNATKAKTDTSEFEVLSSLKLPGKSNLILVKVDSERLLVALDPTGVKSVTHLSDSFADKLESYSEISEPFAHSEPEFQTQLQEMATKPEPAVYSRDSLTRKQMQPKPTQKSQAARSERATRNTEAIREQMEAALLKFGLKV